MKGKTITQRPKKVKAVAWLILGEQPSTLAYHIEKQGNLFSASNSVDTQGSPQQRIMVISTTHHQELPRLSDCSNLGSPQPDEISIWHEFGTGYDHSSKAFHGLRQSAILVYELSL